jgi:hypothetical protein
MHDQERITRTLQHIAEQEIQDDMDLWNALQEKIDQLDRHQPPRVYTRFSGAGQLLAAIIATLLLSIAAYAIYQSQFWDRTFEALDEAHLVTHIDESVNVRGVNVTLEWAYADANRITVAYSYNYDRQAVPVPEEGIYPQVVLTTTDGTIIPPSELVGGGGGGGGSADGPVSLSGVNNFDASVITGSPETLDLTMSMEFLPASQRMPDSPVGGSGGGGGGGGGGGQPQDPVATPNLPTSIPVEDFEPFTVTFDFTVPFIPMRVVEPQETVTQNDLSITLNRVSVTPSLTQLDLCYQVPDSALMWLPLITINIGEETFAVNARPVEEFEDGQVCQTHVLDVPYLPGQDPSSWTITIDGLRSSFPATLENAERAAEALREMGYQVDLYPAETYDGSQTFYIGFAITNTETQVDPMQLNRDVQLVMAELGQLVEGPWIFNVTIP